MKKIRLSLLLALSVTAGAAFALVPNARFITAGWYGQTMDAPPSYDVSNFIPAAQLNTKCPSSSEHLCAVKLKADGTLDSAPNTRRSIHNYQP